MRVLDLLKEPPVQVNFFGVTICTAGWFRVYRVAYRELDMFGRLGKQKVIFIYKQKRGFYGK